MDLGFKRHRPVDESWDGLEIHFLDLTSLKLRAGYFVPFIVSRRLSSREVVPPEKFEEKLSPVLVEISRFTASIADSFTVFVAGGWIPKQHEEVRKEMERSHLVILDQRDIQAVVNAVGRSAQLKSLVSGLVYSLGREALSPYLPGRPARGGRFFGRSDKLKTVLSRKGSGGNFTIVGNRRIGKTSLLKEVKSQLRLTNSKILSAELYGSKCNSTIDVLYSLLAELDPRNATKVMAEIDFPQNFPRHIHSLAEKRGVEVAVFIDELDRILEFDEKQGYQLLHLLRNTFEHENCRIIFAGFRKAMDAMDRDDTPLFNFTHRIELTRLSREETNEMVARPLALLGLDVSQDMVASIFRETDGQPELIQVFGSAILRFAEEQQRVPDPTSLLEIVFRNDIFEQKVLATFIANANNIEQLVVYLLIRRAGRSNIAGYEFSHADIGSLLSAAGLHNVGTKEIYALTKNLTTGGIIARVTGAAWKYRFTIPQLARYCVGMDIDYLIESTLGKLDRSVDVIWDESDEERISDSAPDLEV
jgi:hypothetical protein